MSDQERIFAIRREFTHQRMAEFVAICRSKLDDSMDVVLGDHGCIYAVGSAGRLETTANSDLDVFLADMSLEYGSEQHTLSTAILKSAVTRSLRAMRLPDPSNGGEYLQLHTTDELVKQIGQRTDDPQNTFTARMLLLLESRPLIGEGVYQSVVDRVLRAYWKDYERHQSDYVPILLINDIVRYWRVLLLNYVAMNVRQTQRDETDSDRKRRLRSYKLRFARCLTCYSALAYLLAFEVPGISPEQVQEMVHLCPYERLRAVKERTKVAEAKDLIDALLQQYSQFLETIDQEKSKLLSEFDPEHKDLRFREGEEFGQNMATLMLRLGERAPRLFRYMIV